MASSQDDLLSRVTEKLNHESFYLKKFRVYETPSNLYMIGRDKSRTCWRVLKIDRTEPTELNIVEDPTTYSEFECFDLLTRIHEGNKAVGGLKLLAVCYGIIGFVRFLGPYYMLVITKRRKLGTICGHTIYGVSKSKMIQVPSSAARKSLPNTKDENRYKKLLCTVDLTKDFYFSYSYHVMRSLQKNLTDYKRGQFVYETMFVWNEFLTRGIRNHLKNTLWTVALVYGFFDQVDLSVGGRPFTLTLIARRSRHYAGTRYLKRGVNERGRVANDVETEQIVIENASEGLPMQISSVVQIRGSIPLYWSQNTSRIVVKPDITLSRQDHNYEATRLHFENLVKRYGNPIIILNLIKRREKKPRETILRAEFANAIRFINSGLEKENQLRFFQWDLHKHSTKKAISVLMELGNMAAYALKTNGIFYCQAASNVNHRGDPDVVCTNQRENGDCFSDTLSSQNESDDNLELEICNGSCSDEASTNHNEKPLTLQRGVLRTNCIDCLARTNVAQYAYGLAAFGHQLYTLGLIESPKIDIYDPLADELMKRYEIMGDILAFQYGGSAAHNKIFSERRGQWKPAMQSQELFRTVQRYYNNAYLDREKQDSINVFLGHFQPQHGRPALWELDSDQHLSVGRRDSSFPEEGVRMVIKRSLSDGNIPSESDTPIAGSVSGCNQPLSSVKEQGVKEGLSDSTPQIRICDNEIHTPCRSYTPIMSQKQFLKYIKEENSPNSDHIGYDDDDDDDSNFSNFMDSDWLTSSGNSCEEETRERSHSNIFPRKVGNEQSNNVKEDERTEGEPSRDDPTLAEFPEFLVKWVCDGGLLFY